VARKQLLRQVEFGWHICVFLLLMGAFVPMLRPAAAAGADPVGGDPLSRALLLLGLGTSIVMLALYPRKSASLIMCTPGLWILIGWLFASALWSASPDISLRRASLLLMATLYGMLLFLRFDFDDLIRILAMALGIALTASLIAIFLQPSWAIMTSPHTGAWRGVFSHKNAFGLIAVLSSLVFGTFFLRSRTYRSRLISAGFLALSTYLVIMSRSATATVLMGLVVGGFLLLWPGTGSRRGAAALLIGGIPVAVAVGVLALLNIGAVLDIIGKDSSLTGRVPLWEALTPFIAQRPWLGYGFGAFWLGWQGPSAQIWTLIEWLPPHAHNGYLDLWLEVGILGALLIMGLLAYLVFRSWQLRMRDRLEGFFWLLFLGFIIAANVSQATMLESSLGKVFYWVLLAYLCFTASSSLRPQREVASRPATDGN
jgi:O-antigen ligase